MRDWLPLAARALLRTLITGRDDPPPLTTRRWAWWTASTLLALLIGVLIHDTVAEGRHSPLVSAAVALLAVAPLALLPRWPLLAWRVAWVGMLVTFAPAWWVDASYWPWVTQFAILLLVLLVAAIRHPAPTVLWMGVLTCVPALRFDVPDYRFQVVVPIVVVLVLGYQIGRRRQAQQTLRVEHARRSVLEERARIARELHDVVAHHLSMITVRAQTAEYRIPGLSADALAELGELGDAAREALTEMRLLLGVLRSENAPADRAPQPGLDNLDGLLETARAAGVRVEATVTGDAVLPAGVNLTGYRIVQEALSNATRHAPGAAVRIRVRRERTALEIDVHNAASATMTPAGAGHGLLGMRERVAMLGGELSAGPAADGGWLVSARLPYGHD